MTSPVWFSTLVQGGHATASAGPAFSLRTDPCERYYALTIDDGPFPGHTEKIVKALETSHAPATFFNTGAHAAANPELVALERTVGPVGAHSWGHDDYTKLHPTVIASDLRRTNAVLGPVKMFRPPFGASNDKVRAEVKRAGMTEVMWTLDTKDFEPPYTVERLVAKASKVKDGGIILLHDGWPNTAKAIPSIVNDLRARGLCPGKITLTQKASSIMQDAGAYSPYPFKAKAVKP